MARWCVWVAPPLEPFAPSLAAHGIVLERLLVVRAAAAHKRRGSPNGIMWAFEQSLGSGACDIAMAWAKRPRTREVRRLQLAAERGRTLGVLFRPREAARESSYATLRMTVDPSAHGVRVALLKSKGGVRGCVELNLQGATNALHGS
jgi:hypothetical protein